MTGASSYAEQRKTFKRLDTVRVLAVFGETSFMSAISMMRN
jgi:hypothetical protein